MKNIYGFVVLVLTMLCFSASAQKISVADKKLFQKKEDSLRVIGDSMINANYAGKRFINDSLFTKILVRGLVIKNSFHYPFSSLETISIQYPPDSSFRIFTWQMKKDEYFYLQKGAIQMNTNDGSLKLFPLFDASMFTAKPNDSIRSRKTWIGAIYYNIIQKEYSGKNYYTLLGFDDYTISSNRKWMEVMHFDETNGEPMFGGQVISFKEDTGKLKNVVLNRFNIEYKKEARTTFNYNPEMDMIIYDHLISETEQPERKESYIPDGDFEGFKWQNGQWLHVDKVFDFKLRDGEAPNEEPLRDRNGNINEDKLMEQSIKNEQKTNQPEKKEEQPKQQVPAKKKKN